jgi:parvulin-like peptidyl-prolyl isomerase
MYGGQRVIADIMLRNVREATVARERCRTEPFEKVAMSMSIDPQTAPNGGVWPPFSAQASQGIPPVIVQAAFTTDEGKISDILQTSDNCHIIKVLKIIPPKIVKYEDVKDIVRKQLEEQLVQSDIKKLREELTARAQALVKIDDPILKAQWEEMLAKSRARTSDRATIKKEMDEKLKQEAAPATAPVANPIPGK